MPVAGTPMRVPSAATDGMLNSSSRATSCCLREAVRGDRVLDVAEQRRAGRVVVAELLGSVAPRLEHGVAEQRVAHEPAAEVLAEDSLAPLAVHVPVVGDLVVVADRVGRDVGQRATDLDELRLEVRDLASCTSRRRPSLRRTGRTVQPTCRCRGRSASPRARRGLPSYAAASLGKGVLERGQRRRPDRRRECEQVHRAELAEADEVAARDVLVRRDAGPVADLRHHVGARAWREVRRVIVCSGYARQLLGPAQQHVAGRRQHRQQRRRPRRRRRSGRRSGTAGAGGRWGRCGRRRSACRAWRACRRCRRGPCGTSRGRG